MKKDRKKTLQISLFEVRGGDRGEKWRRRIEEEDGMVRRQRFVANRSQTMGKK